jgi:hypothetical protein
VRRLLTVAIVAAVLGIGAAAAVEALRGSSSEQASPAGTTATGTTATVTEASTGPTATEPVTVTGLADVPTTTEEGTDLLPKSAPPWHTEFAVCRTHSFGVVYNRDSPAILVTRGEDVLAWAGLYRRDVSDECRNEPGKRRRWSNRIPEGIYESVALRCNAPGRVQIDVRPSELYGSVNGSVVVVGVAGTTNWLVTANAVNDVGGRRVYVDEKYCERA